MIFESLQAAASNRGPQQARGQMSQQVMDCHAKRREDIPFQ